MTVSKGGQWQPKKNGQWQQPMDEILNYNGNTNKWLNAGKMTTPRAAYSAHAVITKEYTVCRDRICHKKLTVVHYQNCKKN